MAHIGGGTVDYYRLIMMLISTIYQCFCIQSKDDLIYILLWDRVVRIAVFQEPLGQQYFINQNCSFQNCFLTDNRSLFRDVIYFDVILFNSFQVSYNQPESIIPLTRSPEQKYILISTESPRTYPISSIYNGFFNYTFTYKLDSDVTWRFFIVRKKTNNKVIAPKKGVNWIDFNEMEPISDDIKRELQNKNKAAVWLVSHCITPSRREELVVALRKELENYSLSIDTTGIYQCVDPYENYTSPCSYWHSTNGRYSQEVCYRWIKTHYFYLAFENTLCEDYVTEKVLTATKNFVIPIVFGGANYSRFLPKGSYIYANDLEPKDLASMMNDLVHDENKYNEYFKWHRYYSIHHHTESADTDGVCALCAFLNDDKYDTMSNVYTHINWFFKV